jgi:hypothetical protein
MRTSVLVLVGLVGCVESHVVTCDDGRTCPVGATCDVSHGLCIDAQQIEACSGKPDNAACSFSGRNGFCDQDVCLEVVCGDGVQLGEEQCDGADFKLIDNKMPTCALLHWYAGDAITCTSYCTYDQSTCSGQCGDGVEQGDEACDRDTSETIGDCRDLGFYDAGDLTCTQQCTKNVSACTGYCGDGIVNGPEACELGVAPPSETCLDLGFEAGHMACSDQCSVALAKCKQIGWQPSLAPVEKFYGGLWMASADEYFLTGGDFSSVGLVHVVGPQVTYMAGGEPYSTLWGASPADVWTAGRFGQIGHYTGGMNVTTVQAGSSNDDDDLRGMFGFAANDIYAVGGRPVAASGTPGRVLHYNGTTWTNVRSTTGGLSDVWGVGNQVFAVGASQKVQHFPNGSNAWEELDTGVTNANLYGVWGAAANDVFAVGSISPPASVSTPLVLHYNGTWTQQSISTTAPSVISVWGTSGTNVFAVTDPGGCSTGCTSEIHHYDGASWWKLDTGIQPSPKLGAISGTGGTAVAVGDIGAVIRDSHASWVDRTAIAGTGQRWLAAWTTDAHHTYVLGRNELYDKTGSTFANTTGSDSTGTDNATAVWQKGDFVAFVEQTGTLQYKNGSGAWTTVTALTSSPDPGPPLLRAIAGSSKDEIFVGGRNGVIERYNQATNTWTIERASQVSYEITGIWVAAAGDAFAVGSTPTGGPLLLRRASNGTWNQMTAPASGHQLTSVWGSSANDVYAVGSLGTFIHFDGTSWANVPYPVAFTLSGVGGTGPDDVWAVGRNSTILHRDSDGWSVVKAPPLPDFEEYISVSVRGDLVLLVGYNFGPQALVRTGPW